MNLDDQKEIWQRRHSELAGSRFDELASRAQTRAKSFEKTILRRDRIESAAALLVIAAFGYFLLLGGYPWVARVGMAITMLGTLQVVVVLYWTRLRVSRPQNDLPLTEFCAAEISRVERQIRLLRHVNWWYTGPLLLGAIVFFYGVLFSVPLPAHISLPAFAVLCVLILIFGWMIYRMNQRAVKQELMPMRDELAAIHASLTADSTKSEDGKRSSRPEILGHVTPLFPKDD